MLHITSLPSTSLSNCIQRTVETVYIQLMFSMEIRCKQTAVLLYTMATIAIHGVRAKNLNIKTNAILSNVSERKTMCVSVST